MSKTIELTDEQYATITRVAQERGQTPASLITEAVEELRDPDREPRWFDTDDWLRHLGVSEDRIRRANERLVRSEALTADADAR